MANGSKISIYNDIYYSLDCEYNLNTHGNSHLDKPGNNNKVIIKSIFRMKNKNIVCNTNLGNIYTWILFKFRKIKGKNIFSLGGEIFKIYKFLWNLLCILSKKGLKF